MVCGGEPETDNRLYDLAHTFKSSDLTHNDICTILVSRVDDLLVLARGKYANWNRRQDGMPPQGLYEFIAIHDGHVQVEEYEVR